MDHVPDIITVQTPHDNDDDHSSYPSFTSRSKGNKKHKVKLRATFGDKILWDGRQTTFRPLEDLIIGTLLQVNGSYMVSPIFLANYSKQGDTYLGSHEFKATFYTSRVQAQYDKRYFYGILRSVTRAGGLEESMCSDTNKLKMVFSPGKICLRIVRMMVLLC